MLVENPGSLKMNRVAPPMFVPSIVIVTRVPRCAPVGLTFCSVGGAVWADAVDAAARIAIVRLTTGVRLYRTTLFAPCTDSNH